MTVEGEGFCVGDSRSLTYIVIPKSERQVAHCGN